MSPWFAGSETLPNVLPFETKCALNVADCKWPQEKGLQRSQLFLPLWVPNEDLPQFDHGLGRLRLPWQWWAQATPVSVLIWLKCLLGKRGPSAVLRAWLSFASRLRLRRMAWKCEVCLKRAETPTIFHSFLNLLLRKNFSYETCRSQVRRPRLAGGRMENLEGYSADFC